MAKDKPGAAGTNDEPDAVIDAEPGAVEGAVANLGVAVAANQQDEQGTADAEGQHDTAIQAMDNITDALRVSTEEAVFDARDFMLEQIKHRPKPWSATSQQEQRDVAAKCENAARELVRQLVEVVAARGLEPIRVLLTKVNAGGDDIVINGKVKFLDAEPTERDRAILSLHHAIGKHVMLTRATVDDYAGGEGGREVDGEPDQTGFGFEAGGDEDEPD